MVHVHYLISLQWSALGHMGISVDRTEGEGRGGEGRGGGRKGGGREKEDRKQMVVPNNSISYHSISIS